MAIQYFIQQPGLLMKYEGGLMLLTTPKKIGLFIHLH